MAADRQNKSRGFDGYTGAPRNTEPINAVDTLAMGGAMEEVINEAVRRLEEGQHVGAKGSR